MKQSMMAKPADKNIVSGNSRVKVTIYGQVNRAIRFASTGDETEITSVDNDGSSSRIGIRASGKANPNLTIGALHELEWQENARSGANASKDGVGGGGTDRVRARHVDLWLDHKDMGQLWMGQGSIAGDAAGLFELTGVSFVYGFAGANGTDGTMAAPDYMMKSSAGDALGTTTEVAPTTMAARGFRPFNFFGARENRIMYVTPSLMGLRIRASYGEKKSWSVGARYAGSPGGAKDFTILFAAGFRKNSLDMGAPVESAWAVSGGIKHSSGFNISGSFDTDGKERPNGSKMSQWGVSAGWSGKANDIGGTSIGFGYNRSMDGVEATSQQYWAAINQKIDAAAADVYAGISYDSGTVTHTVMHVDGGATPDGAITASSDDTIDRTCGNIADDAAIDAVVAANGSTCAVKRKGVFNFLVGVRLKF